MGLIKEVWVADIAANLFRDSSFFMRSKDYSEFADNFGIVHIPNSGARPTVNVNTGVPGTPAQRTDVDNTYTLDTFRTVPIYITRAEEIETSYEKRMAVLAEHTDALEAAIGDWMAFRWAPTLTAQILRTSGGNRAVFITGATGTRKKAVKADILAVKRIMDTQDIPQEDRFCCIPAEMYNDLLEDADLLNSQLMGTANLPSGAVNKLYGFTIYIRSLVGRYDNAGTPAPKSPGVATAATDNAAAIFWHMNTTSHSKGATNVFENNNDPIYFGDVISAEMRGGGAKSYTTQIGVVALVEIP